MENIGIRGDILKCLQSNAADSACVFSTQGLSHCFPCCAGVKQGCPLSPNLFGLYIDGLEAELLATPHAYAPTLNGQDVPPLLYADDLALAATNLEGLQQQLLTLQRFCDARGLSVNMKKTKLVCFNLPKKADVQTVLLNNVCVERVQSYKYLGAAFHERKGLKLAADGLLDAGRAAMHGMQRRCAELHISDVGMRANLFKTLVQPVLTYACEVWAVQLIKYDKAGQPVTSPHEHLLISFLKRLLGVQNSTTNGAVLAEFGQYPLRLVWLQLILRFWNRLATSDPAKLVHHAFCESLALASASKASWCGHVQDIFTNTPCLGTLTPGLTVDVPASLAAWEKVYLLEQRSHQGTKTAMYWSIKCADGYHREKYLSDVANTHHRRALALFRTGSHWLPVQTLRPARVPRADRLCSLCSLRQVGDEHHALFVCPAMADLRRRYADVFDHVQTVAEFCSFHQPCRVAYILEQSRLMHLRA